MATGEATEHRHKGNLDPPAGRHRPQLQVVVLAILHVDRWAGEGAGVPIACLIRLKT